MSGPGRPGVERSRPGTASAVIVVLAAALCLGGCGPLSASSRGRGAASDGAPEGRPDGRPGDPADDRRDLPPILVTERGPRGGRLVFLDESGARWQDLTELGTVPVRDNSPAWSPDGRWVVFASSRGRQGLQHTSLWIVATAPGSPPRRLTFANQSTQPEPGSGGPADAETDAEPNAKINADLDADLDAEIDAEIDDRDPAWTPDGSAVVFASSRGGSFDLWRLPLTMSRYGWPVPAGEPVQLTRTARHALHPSVSPDGRRIAFTELDFEKGSSALRLWQDGEVRALTEGPADATPAWSPDGRTVAFAALSMREDGGPDTDLYLVDADGKNRRPAVAEPLAGQTHPVWSPDGRYLFATSLFRSTESGKPVLSSVTFVDLQERPPVLRALHDPAVVESRAGVALGRQPLDVEALGRNLPYERALMLAVEQVLIRNEARRDP